MGTPGIPNLNVDTNFLNIIGPPYIEGIPYQERWRNLLGDAWRGIKPQEREQYIKALRIWNEKGGEKSGVDKPSQPTHWGSSRRIKYSTKQLKSRFESGERPDLVSNTGKTVISC
jgi:hypothetical protein